MQTNTMQTNTMQTNTMQTNTMQTEPTNEPTQFERSPEFFVAEVAHRWISQIERGPEDQIHVGKGQKIDPEKGILHDILEIRISRKMERVNDEPTTKLDPLPPVPPPALAPVVTPPVS